MKYFDELFNQIQNEMEKYYEANNVSKVEDHKNNFLIRMKIKELVIEELKNASIDNAKQAILYLLENTGCAEDLQIYLHFIKKFLKETPVLDSFLNEAEKISPVNRWE